VGVGWVLGSSTGHASAIFFSEYVFVCVKLYSCTSKMMH